MDRNTRSLTIVAQDPSVRLAGRILTAKVDVPAEELAPGPTGYRVKVVDYDASTNTLFKPLRRANGARHNGRDPFAKDLDPKRAAAKFNAAILGNPRFHAYNAYAIVMRTLARFEFALGRRVAWGFGGHQLHVAPHAFSDANAFYSEQDRGLFFGYFRNRAGAPVFTCLSHDVVAHETSHAILDGMRDRYTDPSSPDQGAFHEAFADIVALLSVFSLRNIVDVLLDLAAHKSRGGRRRRTTINASLLTRDKLRDGALLGLADEMGGALSGVRGQALRRSVTLKPNAHYREQPEYQEVHRRGEILVAAMMNAFLDLWCERLDQIGLLQGRVKDRALAVEAGAKAADHLLTMSIRALDYCPPVHITFEDYLTALLTADREVVPDDSRYRYRGTVLANFARFGIDPATRTNTDGTLPTFDNDGMEYSRTHYESMLRDDNEVFRFVWENRKALGLDDRCYAEIDSVRPSTRIGPDGFVLRETIVEYVQMTTLYPRELRREFAIKLPKDFPDERVRIYGGGTLVFDEYGRVKHHVVKPIGEPKPQLERLNYFSDAKYVSASADSRTRFAELHALRVAQ